MPENVLKRWWLRAKRTGLLGIFKLISTWYVLCSEAVSDGNGFEAIK